MPVAVERVTVRSFVDDVLVEESTSARNVYRPVGGRAYLRVLGGRELLTHDAPAVVERRARTLGDGGGVPEEAWDAARDAVSRGCQVRVVGLFDPR